MNIPSTLRRRRSEEGVVAIELASVLFLFILLLSLLLFWARVFWYYSMAHKAAHDAARYLSRATPAEIQTFGSGYSEAPAAGVARWIVESELGVLRPLMRPMWVYVECGARNGTGTMTYGYCGSRVPEMVRVHMELGFSDALLPTMLLEFFGQDQITLDPDVAMRYVGS
jgi:cbb3-type cytochrome oxidase subunit 3